MKYWEIKNNNKISLKDQEEEYWTRIVSITKTDNNEIRLREECDEHFSTIMLKEQVIEALQEAIDWIKE